jgi:hypothetical protein
MVLGEAWTQGDHDTLQRMPLDPSCAVSAFPNESCVRTGAGLLGGVVAIRKEFTQGQQCSQPRDLLLGKLEID